MELPGWWPWGGVQTLVKVAVCWKWMSFDTGVEREDGGVADGRWAGVSPADSAALEVALLLAGSDNSNSVTVLCLAPAAADDTLRTALAAGARDAIRVDASTDLDSRVVASALANQVRDADLVVCGDYSLDRGTGSVPAFLAAELHAAQALGLVEVEPTPSRTSLRGLRRLDGGRREVLDIPIPAVISVEGSVARLRRASLTAEMSSRGVPIRVVPAPRPNGRGGTTAAKVLRYRPRTRAVRPPVGNELDRVREILDIGGESARAEAVSLDPPAAAARILEQLQQWGYGNSLRSLGDLHSDPGS